MPYYEARRCEECGCEWDDVDTSEVMTIGTIDPAHVGTFTLYSCPRCFLTLRVQREFDGNSWRHRRRALPHAPNDPSSKLVAQVSDRISAILAAQRTIYQPVTIELGRIDCIKCERPFVLGPVDPPHPQCPECRGFQTICTGAGGIVTLYSEPSPGDRA